MSMNTPNEPKTLFCGNVDVKPWIFDCFFRPHMPYESPNKEALTDQSQTLIQLKRRNKNYDEVNLPAYQISYSYKKN